MFMKTVIGVVHCSVCTVWTVSCVAIQHCFCLYFRFAKMLDSLLSDYRQMTMKLEELMLERNITADAIRYFLLIFCSNKAVHVS